MLSHLRQSRALVLHLFSFSLSARSVRPCVLLKVCLSTTYRHVLLHMFEPRFDRLIVLKFFSRNSLNFLFCTSVHAVTCEMFNKSSNPAERDPFCCTHVCLSPASRLFVLWLMCMHLDTSRDISPSFCCCTNCFFLLQLSIFCRSTSCWSCSTLSFISLFAPPPSAACRPCTQLFLWCCHELSVTWLHM